MPEPIKTKIKPSDLSIEDFAAPSAAPNHATQQRTLQGAKERPQKAPAAEMAALQAKVTTETHLAMKLAALQHGQNLGEFLTDCFNAYMQRKQ